MSKPIIVSDVWHNRLTELSREETFRNKRRVSMAELVHGALEKAYGDPLMISADADIIKSLAGMDDETLFAKLVEAASLDHNGGIDEFPENLAYERHGRKIPIRRLAHYLRRTKANPTNMIELIRAFEYAR